MNEEVMIERIYSALITGDRTTARSVVQECLDRGETPEELTFAVIWPTLENINKLFRADQLSTLAHHYAVRVLRQVLDQLQTLYLQHPNRDRRVLIFCGESETDDLAAQLVADVVEADGYEVLFGGGGIAADEIIAEVGAQQPDVLLMFASSTQDAPKIRTLIDTIKTQASVPNMQFVVGGGIFARADGLAEEIGADLWANHPEDLLSKLDAQPERRATAEQRTVGRGRTVRKSEAA